MLNLLQNLKRWQERNNQSAERTLIGSHSLYFMSKICFRSTYVIYETVPFLVQLIVTDLVKSVYNILAYD